MSESIMLEDLGDHIAEIIEKARAVKIDDFEPEARGVFNEAVAENFRETKNPFTGAIWRPRRIVGDGHPLLIDTSAMFNAAMGTSAGSLTEVTTDTITFGIDGGTIDYAAKHEFGLDGMPVRAFFGMSPPWVSEMAEAVADYYYTIFAE